MPCSLLQAAVGQGLCFIRRSQVVGYVGRGRKPWARLSVGKEMREKTHSRASEESTDRARSGGPFSARLMGRGGQGPAPGPGN